MDLNDKIITVLIAGSVSLVASCITYLSALKKIKAEKEILKKELAAKFTEKIYDIRIQHYPLAFEITEILGKTKSLRTGNLDIEAVLDNLTKWKAGAPSFIMSNASLEAYWDLKRVLNKNPQNGIIYSDKQMQNIWKARNEFRKSLRKDIGLLLDVENSD